MTIYSTPAVDFSQDQIPATTSDLHSNIIRSAKCSRIYNRSEARNWGDGIYDQNSQRYLIEPCNRKNCPRHWRRYARKRFRDIASILPQRNYWYHLILYCPIRYTKGREIQRLWRVMTKLKCCYPDLVAIITHHRGRNRDHHHITLGISEAITESWIRIAWKSHYPGKKQHQWQDALVYIRKRQSPWRNIKYTLRGRNNKPHIKPPWKGLPFKSPIKTIGL